ncbi:MAG: beta-galactosidase [bacterium]
MSAPQRTSPDRFLSGVNYWPAVRGFHWWRDFDSARVAEDLRVVQETGWRAVRVLLDWEELQPRQGRISTRALDALVRTAEIADRRSLQIQPALFTCHAGGVNWAPAWMLRAREEGMRFPVFSSGRVRWNAPRNFYSEAEMLQAQVLLVREVSGALQGHPALRAWDLANQPSRLIVPPDREALRLWLRVMTEELRSRNTKVPVTLTLDAEDLWGARMLAPRHLGESLDFLSLHAVSGACPFEESSADGAVAPFLGVLARWLGGGKDVLLAACGSPTWPSGVPAETLDPDGKLALVTETRASDYMEKVLARSRETGMLGAFVWCYADCAPALWQEPPFDLAPRERFFGVFRGDGSPKAAHALFRSFTGLPQASAPPAPPEWIDVSPEEYERDALGQAKRLYKRYRERVADC